VQRTLSRYPSCRIGRSSTTAKDVITLAFVQDWTVKYNKGENIGLVPEESGGPDKLGMFLLDETGGGYEQDTIFTDGPIIYGTGMNDEDRQKAWKRFFLQMVEAVIQQQGKDTLSVKLAKRCLPNQDICTTMLDAMLVGIGGIREPRRVAVIVATDVHDQNKQLSRMVCTWPAKGTQVCRDWDTGKLMTTHHAAQWPEPHSRPSAKTVKPECIARLSVPPIHFFIVDYLRTRGFTSVRAVAAQLMNEASLRHAVARGIQRQPFG
jgi:hypothetical protein